MYIYVLNAIGGVELKKIEGNRMCEECRTILFEKRIATSVGGFMKGWSCPECFTTKWEEMDDEIK